MIFKIPPEFLPSKWWPNRPLMMQSDLPTLSPLPEAGQSLFWPPVLPTYPGHETGGVATVEQVRAVLSWSQPIPAGSATDPPCATAEPVRRVCGAPVKTYWGKGRKCQRGGDKPGREHQRGQGGKEVTRIERGNEGRVRSEELEVLHDQAGTPPKGLWPTEGPHWSRVMKWLRRKQKRKKRVRNKERQRETTTSWPQTPVPLIASLKILSVICGDNKRGGDVSGAQLSLGKGKERCFNVCLLCFPIPESATKYIKAIN